MKDKRERFIKSAHAKLPDLVTVELCEEFAALHEAARVAWPCDDGEAETPDATRIFLMLHRMIAQHCALDVKSTAFGPLVVYTHWDPETQAGECGIAFSAGAKVEP